MTTPSSLAAPAGSVLHTYKHLSLEWNETLGAWTCPLPELDTQASLRLFTGSAAVPPPVLACEVALATLALIDRIDLDARRHLESEAAAHLGELYERAVTLHDFAPCSLDLGGEGAQADRFALTYRARFDVTRVWKVRFRGLVPLHWRVEQSPPAAADSASPLPRVRGQPEGTALGVASARLLRRCLNRVNARTFRQR
ncbi:hypothetical protein [Caldimonas brevitalea]|uniref:Uncharacterized protein n=1 Tax=Caldimonas brevitalea TaxID=413882 RepID=A0A0G3BHN2_9BURK|nr:hypothetical protein [Caldimonas brevitalea]AKJ27498.1 hypothetical protein AAW51_0807 [Caldimonas brevitalea]